MKKGLTTALLIGGLSWVLLPAAAQAKRRKDVPIAPLPSIIVNAQKVFLTNGGGSNLAYDAFYSEMKKWGKYQIVGTPDDADLIVELAYRVQDRGTRVWSSTNVYTGATEVVALRLLTRSFC
jgi:hypothetical protein